jgi:elongation factor Ts
MTEIAAALVKELRDQTGAGMMDSKRALQDTNGDIEAAKTLLRERGLASAAKRAGNETTEGKVGYRVADDAKRGVIVAVGSESEPVSNNQEFLSFASKVLEAVEREGPDAGRTARRGAPGACGEARREHRCHRSGSIRGRRRGRDQRLRTPAGEQAWRADPDPRRLERARTQACYAHRRLAWGPVGSGARTCRTRS